MNKPKMEIIISSDDSNEETESNMTDPLGLGQTESKDVTNKINEAVLIEAMRTKPALWDYSNSFYKNKQYKKYLWANVLTELSMDVNSENIKRVKWKWNNLRRSNRCEWFKAFMNKSIKSTENQLQQDCQSEQGFSDVTQDMPKMKTEQSQSESECETFAGFEEQAIPRKRTAQEAFHDMLGDLMKDLTDRRKHDVRLKLLELAGDLCFKDNETCKSEN